MRITFRISDKKYPDLAAVMQQIQDDPQMDISETCREALRAFLLSANTNIRKEPPKAPELSLYLSDDDKKRKGMDPDEGLERMLSSFN